jgi:hypothetical protein
MTNANQSHTEDFYMKNINHIERLVCEENGHSAFKHYLEFRRILYAILSAQYILPFIDINNQKSYQDSISKKNMEIIADNIRSGYQILCSILSRQITLS